MTQERSTLSEPIFDHTTLREVDDIPYHEDTDVVNSGTVETMDQIPDIAGIGIENDDGEVLLRRLTDTCGWKLPVASVGPDQDFVAAIEDHIAETNGFDINVDWVEGVWDITFQTENDELSASRAFVIFGLSPDNYDLEVAAPTGEPVHDADWFGELPEGVEIVPGTDLFGDLEDT